MDLLTPKIISALHIVFVAPLFYAIATDKLPFVWKRRLTWLAVVVALVHLYRLYNIIMMERHIAAMAQEMEEMPIVQNEEQ